MKYPHKRLLAIGDIHGCSHKLSQLLQFIKPTVDDRLVLLGDYIDRGDDSPAVVEALITLQKNADCIFLRGNHEQMLLDYCAGTDELFLTNGGKLTLQQYRDSRWGEIPSHHMEFFHHLHMYHQQDGFIFVHAGMRPGITLEHQNDCDLLWIRQAFNFSEYSWGKTIVFGHTPFTEPIDVQERIGLDTGAALSSNAGYGKLTCCDVYTRQFWQV